MVAVAGVTRDGYKWKLAPCLVVLVREIKERYPNRSTASDGTIASAAHSKQNPTSDHEADRSDGFVKAIDLTDDPPHFDPDEFCDELIRRRDPRIKYVIKDGHIWRSYDKPGLPAWTPQRYTGPNQHMSHAHISVTDEGARLTRTWFPEEDDMPINDDDVERIARRVQQLLLVDDTRWLDWRLEGLRDRIRAHNTTMRDSLAKLLRNPPQDP